MASKLLKRVLRLSKRGQHVNRRRRNNTRVGEGCYRRLSGAQKDVRCAFDRHRGRYGWYATLAQRRAFMHACNYRVIIWLDGESEAQVRNLSIECDRARVLIEPRVLPQYETACRRLHSYRVFVSTIHLGVVR